MAITPNIKVLEKSLTCYRGETVISFGKKVLVNEVVFAGKEDKTDKKGREIAGERSEITVCRIMDNGQILKNNPMFIGNNWVRIDDEA